VETGFNFKVSPDSYEFIKQTGIPVYIIANDSEKFLVSKDYLENIRNTKSNYAKQIELVHKQPEIVERINREHLQLWDDLVPLYLAVPLLFETEEIGNIRYISISKNIPDKVIFVTIGKILGSATITNNRVFNEFPVDPPLYKPEYAEILNSTIEEFGPTEWKAICMTNEIHGHTGIYSIIGAKMGIRAMEYFNVGVNNLTITTFAGNKPPLSCFNDGIQISTGATIGQGLISVSDSISTIPSAIFECNNQQVSILLKPEIAEQMQKEIKYGVQHYGLHDEQYWLYIEQLAINYWNSFDRHEIFTIEF
jgi:pyrimidine-specific ribonucleoside hydrolase